MMWVVEKGKLRKFAGVQDVIGRTPFQLVGNGPQEFRTGIMKMKGTESTMRFARVPLFPWEPLPEGTISLVLVKKRRWRKGWEQASAIFVDYESNYEGFQ